jgi:hypothetical protein
LKAQNRKIRESQIQLCIEPKEEDVRRILKTIDKGYDRMFTELEKVKIAIEDIFNPSEEEESNISIPRD